MKAIDFHGFQVDSAGLSGCNPSEFFPRSPGEMRSAESPPENPPHQQSQARQKFHSVESRKRAVKHPEARHRRRSGVARHEIDASPERDNLRLDDEGENERQIFLTAAKWVPETTRFCFAIEAQAGKQTSLPVRLEVRKKGMQQAASAR